MDYSRLLSHTTNSTSSLGPYQYAANYFPLAPGVITGAPATRIPVVLRFNGIVGCLYDRLQHAGVRILVCRKKAGQPSTINPFNLASTLNGSDWNKAINSTQYEVLYDKIKISSLQFSGSSGPIAIPLEANWCLPISGIEENVMAKADDWHIIFSSGGPNTLHIYWSAEYLYMLP